MNFGFVKVASATTDIKVADCKYNTSQILSQIKTCHEQNVKLVCFPELCISSYTCSDLFLHPVLINACEDAIITITKATLVYTDIVVIVGAPLNVFGKLFNCAVAICNGEILGVVPKSYLPNYGEFYERRHFTPANKNDVYDIEIQGYPTSFGVKQLFRCSSMPEFCFAIEICEDLWIANPPSINHALAGATIIVNPSASDEIIGKEQYRRDLVCGQSARLLAGYIYSDAGDGESTTDLVFSGHNLIAENGTLLKESTLFENSTIISEIDVQKLSNERRKMNTFELLEDDDYIVNEFSLKISDTSLSRSFTKHPFIPSDSSAKAQRCEAILNMQSHGLKKRLQHAFAKTAVVGISGGLDSCLALIVTVRAMDLLKRPRTDIVCVTMPCFGTTSRTKNNAEELSKLLGVTLKCIDISESVKLHFKDISHDINNHDVTFENGQARERTQVLMNIANQTGGLVVGTGDLSELALGWATYNGDHMSMYGVNASVPKTLIRHITKHAADTYNDENLKKVLYDILDTPVSPELLPATEDDNISQKTEDLVGPYELHDFFLYYCLRWSFSPSKIFKLACISYKDVYDKETILKWLRTFFRRFFMQQFKRSCLPDGAKVGTVTLSPRGDWRMPSDACANLWLDEIDQIEI